MKRFAITLVAILLISASAFWLISMPHPWQTEVFRYALFGVFLGVSLAMSLYHLFLYAFAARERVYLLYAATCLVMLLRFVIMQGGILSLLMRAYPWQLGRVSDALLTVHGGLGLWFSTDALRLPVSRARRIVYIVCLGISFFGTLVLGSLPTIMAALVPLVMLVVQALGVAGIRRNPYRLTYVAAVFLFSLFTLLGALGPFKGYFVIGVFPWTFFFFSQAILLSVEYSETRRREREMAESNALLENLNRVKYEFFSNISHEMKTPLTVISTDIVLTGKHIERGEYSQALALLDNAQSEVMHAADLVTDALRFARNQESADAMAPFDLGALIRATAAVFDPIARAHGNTLSVELDDERPGMADGPLILYGNADTLGSALVNLLTNANGHTRGGTIHIRCAAVDGGARIVVADDGDGIAAALLPHVFERGVTGGEGTGLGLAIVKSIVAQHGGEVSLRSTQGAGTTVTVTLPVAGRATA